MMFFVCACTLVAGSIHAQDGWMEWIEKMSGPGPWFGGGPVIPAVCWNKDGDASLLCLPRLTAGHPHRPEDDRHILQGGLGFFSTFSDTPRFENTPDDKRRIHLTRIDVRYYFRPHQSVDIGGSLLFWRFSGEGAGDFAPFWQPGFTGSVVFTPLALKQKRDQRVNGWLRVFKANADASVIFGLTGDKFNNPAFSKKEIIRSVGLILDFFELIRY
jgi:hypothetical protein